MISNMRLQLTMTREDGAEITRYMIVHEDLIHVVEWAKGIEDMFESLLEDDIEF